MAEEGGGDRDTNKYMDREREGKKDKEIYNGER